MVQVAIQNTSMISQDQDYNYLILVKIVRIKSMYLGSCYEGLFKTNAEDLFLLLSVYECRPSVQTEEDTLTEIQSATK